MNINDLLKGCSCSCGKHHSCDIRYVYVERGAIGRLREICPKGQRILIVADENTFGAAGEQTLSALSHTQTDRVIFSGKELLIPNEAAIHTVTQGLKDTQMIVGIGSGVIQDLCKYVSHKQSIPYLIIATAPSMDGYASNGAAMITNGMKVTYAAGLPYAILGDTEVLKQAPMEMLRAGYGDIIGKFSALNDWKLSHLVNGEPLCQSIYDQTYEQIRSTLALADGIQQRDEAAVGTLMEALVVIGIMMSFAGSSRPASGSEHHLSHFFEITGILNQEAYFPHGIDVAYSTLVTQKLREALLSRPFPQQPCRPSKEKCLKELRRIYSSVADGCIQLQEKVGNYKAPRFAVYSAKEAEIKDILREVPSSEELCGMLASVGLRTEAFYELYSKEKLKDAILYAKDLKDRYTVLWLYYDLMGGNEHA